jgi:hypothetical protein
MLEKGISWRPKSSQILLKNGPAMSVELFRYRGALADEGTYSFGSLSDSAL